MAAVAADAAGAPMLPRHSMLRDRVATREAKARPEAVAEQARAVRALLRVVLEPTATRPSRDRVAVVAEEPLLVTHLVP